MKHYDRHKIRKNIISDIFYKLFLNKYNQASIFFIKLKIKKQIASKVIFLSSIESKRRGKFLQLSFEAVALKFENLLYKGIICP